ncbi:lipopolysaccharide heptosyltransferase II [Rubinisphaera margarita]|uniref:lipopolysaccharide heptosyltransferase II n=1 Tax=Rubinisphaera margarita TaxID=2909586 RepID=UPI001EE8253E|nr:lipopolysaccharide heptosyltransferase II [Rubinisphaera margarita]MCG6154439.1 lipopolysaccharide heptosyltransferase II [Rubinisphaera margarita]
MSSRIVNLLNEIEPRRIVIIKPSALGDVVQTMPLLPVLKQRFPGATIDWVIRSELVDLLEGHPLLNRVLIYERKGGFSASIRLLRELRKGRYDLCLDLQGLLRSAVMTAATGATLRVGLQTAREYSHLACHGLLPETERGVPAHARYWRVAEALGETGSPAPVSPGLSEQDRQRVDSLIGGVSGPFLVIHPGAMWETKRWPIPSFAEIGVRALREYGMNLIVVGTRGERNAAEDLCSLVREKRPHQQVLNLAGETSLTQLAEVLRRAALVLSNDSGPMHLAAGVGTPVVGIFTCTSAERSGPAGGQHQLVQAKVPCAASYRKQCPFSGSGHMQCLTAVSVFQVWSAVQQAVTRNQLASNVA